MGHCLCFAGRKRECQKPVQHLAAQHCGQAGLRHLLVCEFPAGAMAPFLCHVPCPRGETTVDAVPFRGQMSTRKGRERKGKEGWEYLNLTDQAQLIRLCSADLLAC